MAPLWPEDDQLIDIMTRLQAEYFADAESKQRFSPQLSELHVISVSKGLTPHIFRSTNPEDSIIPLFEQARSHHSRNNLRCLIQRTRPLHISGRSDALPFHSIHDAQVVFQELDLPASYFQISDGSVAAIQTTIVRDESMRAVRLELISYVLTNQGNWSMALTHNANKHITNVFWSFDKCINESAPPKELASLQDLACHPMLVPCIMLSMTLDLAIQRRKSLKGRLKTLEQELNRLRGVPVTWDKNTPAKTMSGFSITAVESRSANLHTEDFSSKESDHAIAVLFDLLHSCQRDQASRKGRYSTWQNQYDAVQVGFEYVAELLRDEISCEDQGREKESEEQQYYRHLRQVHMQLVTWATIIWRKLQSLQARDQDHNDNLDRLAGALNNIVLQRDMRLQASIARVAQRDSEDMKFIAILGSIFLPANLVASLLNVSAFVFLPGGKLFAAYLGISAILIAIVVIICIAKPYRRIWSL